TPRPAQSPPHWFCEPKASLTDNSTAQHSSPTMSDTLGVCARKSDKFAIAVACLRTSQPWLSVMAIAFLSWRCGATG
ncbi:MAG: hypothetical protein NT013_16130, partial [Planctomycetia bacterium]|nr:hypothetical protein [Planctomycetia bacterium]